MKSLMYLSPLIYTASMRLLYWPNFEERYRTVARLIPPGASVVDVCCGDAYLYRRYLSKQGVKYLGLDSSPEMIHFARREGVRAELWDAYCDVVPRADVVIMQGSLCHFMSKASEMVERLRAAANMCVIVSEPIRERAEPKSVVCATLSKIFTTPVNDDGGYEGKRFTAESFSTFASGLVGFERFHPVPGGRDLVAIFSSSAIDGACSVSTAA